jgi:ATP-binding cassette, subfamily F, member 3
MLTVQQIQKSYGINQVLREISFNLKSGERLALIGPNGCGKSTLIKILAGIEQPDSGSLRFTQPDVRVGYLPQSITFNPEDTIDDYLNRYDLSPAQISRQLEILAGKMVTNPQDHSLQDEYDRLISIFSTSPARADSRPRVLAALGLSEFEPATLVAHLSGGQKTRLALAGILISEPNLLLLDEPTNHLDMHMLTWLESWLKEYPGGILVVSHDRTFLEQIPTSILEINPTTHHGKVYPGNYDDYVQQKSTEIGKQWLAYSDQQVEIAQLKSAASHLRDVGRFKKGGKADTGDKFAKGFFANRSKATIGRAKQIEAKIDQILTEEKIEKPGSSWKMKMTLATDAGGSRDVVVTEDLTVGYPDTPILSKLNLSIRFGSRCALIGANGSGKTTLMKTIAGLLPPLSGKYRVGTGVNPGYLSQAQDELVESLSAYDHLFKITGKNETDVRAYLHQYLFTSENVMLPASVLSPGERSRLALAAYIAQGKNFLLLDEPLNHLDISSREQFEAALLQFSGTVLITVHDRYFIDRFATHIWEAKDRKVFVK